MAQKEVIKKYLLITFLSLCVVLIFSFWIDGVLGLESASPGYYRATAAPNQTFYLTRTAEYKNIELGTPAPEHEHEGQGHGNNEARHTLTPEPTTDWDAIEEDQ